MSTELPTAGSSNAAITSATSSNRAVVLWCLGALTVMGSLTAASPTLYKIFCQVTGYGGTTQRAIAPSDHIVDRLITVRFDANVSPGLPWKFEPVQSTMDVKLGENHLAFYRATNLSDKPVTGTAAFNVSPDTMGLFFSKIACFCFTEQTLKPGQTVEMPVTFFVDPKMLDDRDTRHLQNITLSYVFYPVKETASAKVGTAAPIQ
ncbi:MAG TPA: cytochrome c oxidase assembly protein [Hyphomicrobium sp.]|nr:cytochrome c oxidase assembly protein [Hyphomicrobium sp.]